MMVVTAVEAVLIVVLNANVRILIPHLHQNVKITCPPRSVWKSKRGENVTNLGLSRIAPRPVVIARYVSFGQTPISMQTTFKIIESMHEFVSLPIAFPSSFSCDLFHWNEVICFVGIKSNLLLLLIFNYRVQSVVYFLGVGEGGPNC